MVTEGVLTAEGQGENEWPHGASESRYSTAGTSRRRDGGGTRRAVIQISEVG
jgi:hypothetical protein